MAHEIFISYSHKDKTTADAVCSHLESRGMRCWYAPRDITPGDEWGSAILNGIENARIMVLIFTKDANLSQQVLREVNNAVNAGLSIIPFRLTEEEPAAGMRYYLSTVHWMDAMNEELEQAIQSLGDLCQAVLEKKAVPPTAPRKTEGAKTEAPAPGKKKNKAILIAAIGIIIAAVGILAAVLLKGKGETQSADVETPASSSEVITTSSQAAAVSTEAATATAAPTSTEPAVVTFDGNDPEDKTKIDHEETTDEIPESPVTADNVTEDLSVTYTDGNNQGNITNGGHLAYDGEWYYYTGNDEDRMHRIKADGSKEEKLTDIPASCINVYEDHIYFVSDAGELFRMKKDGSELTSLLPYGGDNARILKGRIYYGDTDLRSIALDGSDERDENQIDGYDVQIDGTYVYYIGISNGHIYRADMDGSNVACVYNRRATSLRLAGNKLFFYEDDRGWFSSYNINTGELLQLTNDPVNAPVVTSDGIYGGSGHLQIVFLAHDKVGVKLLTDSWADTVNVAGEKIFYRDGDDDCYYMMDLDGSNKTRL